MMSCMTANQRQGEIGLAPNGVESFYQQVREHYDCLAGVYRTFWGEHLHHGLFPNGDESPQQAQALLVDYCLSLLPRIANCRVLDVGCGFGATSILLAERYRCEVTGITLSACQAEHAARVAAKKGLGSRAAFVVANIEQFTFPEEYFDLVWTVEASEHFLDREQFFKNTYKSLRLGGLFLLASWTAASHKDATLNQVAKLSVCSKFQTAAEYVQQIRAAQLWPICCKDLSAKVIPTWHFAEKRAAMAQATACVLPNKFHELAAMVRSVAGAFTSGRLKYHVFVAGRFH